MEQHYRNIHPLSLGLDKCPLSCKPSYGTPVNVNSHLASSAHEPEKDILCPFAGCTKWFRTYAACVAHGAGVHEDPTLATFEIVVLRN